MDSPKLRWKSFHSALSRHFQTHPGRYRELLKILSTEAGFTKYQGTRGYGAIRKAVERIPEGQGAMREPILLEYLMKEIEWPPERLFGIRVAIDSPEEFDSDKLARDVADHVISKLTEQKKPLMDDDRELGRSLKRLMKLQSIAYALRQLTNHATGPGRFFLANYRSLFSSDWFSLAPRLSGDIAVDEAIWSQALVTPESPRSEVLGLVLAIIYAFGCYSAICRLFGLQTSNARLPRHLEKALTGVSPEEVNQTLAKGKSAILQILRWIDAPGFHSMKEVRRLTPVLLMLMDCLFYIPMMPTPRSAVPRPPSSAEFRNLVRSRVLGKPAVVDENVYVMSMDQVRFKILQEACELLSQCFPESPAAVQQSN